MPCIVTPLHIRVLFKRDTVPYIPTPLHVCAHVKEVPNVLTRVLNAE